MELLSSLFGSRSIRNQKVDNENMSGIMSEVNSPMQLNQETPERSAMVRKVCMHMRRRLRCLAETARSPQHQRE